MRLLLVDGHACAYRSFYAIRGMRSPAGETTGAVFGFVKALERLGKQFGSERVCESVSGHSLTHDSLTLNCVVVWDGGLDGERLGSWPGYKAQRPEMPAELGAQLEGMREFLAAAGVASVQAEGVEADDVIAGLAELAAGEGQDVLIASPDKDFMQLVSGEGEREDGGWRMVDGGPSSILDSRSSAGRQGRIGLLNPGEKSGRIWGAAEVWAKAGVWPSQVVDWLALVGDAVDNIPGVPGVGPKTAAALLGRFGSVAGIYGRLGEVESARLRGALADSEGAVRRNVGLVRLKRLVPEGVSLAGLRGRAPDWERLAGLFRRWGFRGLLAEAEGRMKNVECRMQNGVGEAGRAERSVGSVEQGLLW